MPVQKKSGNLLKAPRIQLKELYDNFYELDSIDIEFYSLNEVFNLEDGKDKK